MRTLLIATVLFYGLTVAYAAAPIANEPVVAPKPSLGIVPAEPPACLPLEPPITPPGLKAAPGNANVTLSWLPQPSRACVDSYLVTFSSLGPQGTRGPTVKLQVQGLNVTVPALENGVNHVFSVEAVARRFTGAGSNNKTAVATTAAVPRAPCDPGATPAPPTNVTAFTDGPGLKLCWKAPPRPVGCVSEYRIATKMVPVTEEESRSAGWSYLQVSTAGCMEFKGLADRRSYMFAVQSFNDAVRAGGYASTQATVVRDWKCMPVRSWYPLCTAAAQGACNPLSCAAQAAAGACASPWLRTLDKTTKTMVQYCAEECGCSTLLGAAGAMAAEPEVTRIGGYASPDGCCKW